MNFVRYATCSIISATWNTNATKSLGIIKNLLVFVLNMSLTKVDFRLPFLFIGFILQLNKFPYPYGHDPLNIGQFIKVTAKFLVELLLATLFFLVSNPGKLEFYLIH